MEDNNETNITPVAGAGNGNPVTTNPESTTPTPVVAESMPEVTPAVPVIDVPSMTTVATDTSVVVADTTTSVGTATPLVNSTVVKQYAIALGIIVLIGCGLLYALVQQGRVDTHMFDRVTGLFIPVPAVAIVNDVKIPMADYDKNRLQLEQSATEAGSDPKDPAIAEQIKQQSLDVLINTELLRQEATKAGITVTEEQIDARYQEIVKGLQGEDKLQARMAELGITKESLLKDIQAEILIQTHLAAAVDMSSITIDPKDIKAAYDQADVNPDSPLPPLEQVSSAIEAQLKQSKEQEMINAYIQKLRDDASIEVTI